jgi:hypothetical protein
LEMHYNLKSLNENYFEKNLNCQGFNSKGWKLKWKV